LLGIKAPYY